MGEARRRSEWARTCEVLAMIYNVNRGKGTPARNAKFFLDQILRRTAPPEIPVTDDMTILKTVFVDGKLPEALG